MAWRKLSTTYVKKVSRRCEELVKFILADVVQACSGSTSSGPCMTGEKQVYESSPKHDACTVLIKGEASERFIIVETRSAEALLDF